MHPIEKVIQRLQYANNTFKYFNTISSGFQGVDELLNGGFMANCLYIIGGYKGIGKRGFLNTIILHNLFEAKKKPKIGVISLNESPELYMQRLLSAVCKIPYPNIVYGRLTDEALNTLASQDAITHLKMLSVVSPKKISENWQGFIQHFINDNSIDLLLINGFDKLHTFLQKKETEIPEFLQLTAINNSIAIIATMLIEPEVVVGKIEKPTLQSFNKNIHIEDAAEAIIALHNWQDSSNNYFINNHTKGGLVHISLLKNNQGFLGDVESIFDYNYQLLMEK